MSTLILDTVDLGEAEDVLSASYTRMRFETSSSTPAHTRVARSGLGWSAFDDIRYGYDFSYDMGPWGRSCSAAFDRASSSRSEPEDRRRSQGPER